MYVPFGGKLNVYKKFFHYRSTHLNILIELYFYCREIIWFFTAFYELQSTGEIINLCGKTPKNVKRRNSNGRESIKSISLLFSAGFLTSYIN